jgi:putative ABC transport system substrate-binding protein
MITRRRLLIALGLNALVISTSTPSANAAPPPGKVLRIGLLDVVYESFDPDSDSVHRALLDGLHAHGYELGRNFMLEFRSARGNPERLAELAAELVRLKVDLLIPVFTQPTLAAREAAKTIPIVMLGATDPVATGVVASLARPGGNITGVSINAAEISAKRVQLLKEAVPKLSRVAVLWNSTLKSMTIGFQQIDMASPGAYVDKIANGAKPADLPVEEPTNFELIINLKAAKTMGLTIPQSLLLRADRLIK